MPIKTKKIYTAHPSGLDIQIFPNLVSGLWSPHTLHPKWHRRPNWGGEVFRTRPNVKHPVDNTR